MSPETVRKLAGSEYDFVRIIGDLTALRDTMRQCGQELPQAWVASRQLRMIRRLVKRVLVNLDGPLSEAIALLEASEPAPF